MEGGEPCPYDGRQQYHPSARRGPRGLGARRLQSLRPQARRSRAATAGRFLARRGEEPRHRRGDRRELRRRARRDLRRHGPVRLRQVHPHPHAQRPVGADGGRRAARRRQPGQGGRQAAARAAPQPGVHGVPALRPPAAPHGARERRLPAGDPGGRQGRAAAEGPGGARHGRPERLGGLAALAALGRHAPARRPRPRARRRHRRPAHGRGLQRPRPADPLGDAGAAPGAAGEARQDDHLHHARPQRGHAPRRPHRGHA